MLVGGRLGYLPLVLSGGSYQNELSNQVLSRVSMHFVQSLRNDDSGFEYKIEQEILHGWLRTSSRSSDVRASKDK